MKKIKKRNGYTEKKGSVCIYYRHVEKRDVKIQ